MGKRSMILMRAEVRTIDRFSAQQKILLWLGSFTMAPTKDFCDSLATAGSEALLLFSARS